MNAELVIADPAGNITALVLGNVRAEDRALAAKRIMAENAAEQAGFVIPPQTAGGLWRLEMMGGEFCGNAARSFGLWVAHEQGLTGKHTVHIEVSGMKTALPVRVDTESGTAEVELPGPLEEDRIRYNEKEFPLIIFEGITHLIAPQTGPDKDLFFVLKGIIEKKGAFSGGKAGALGLMFYDPAAAKMTPLVYVYATGSLVFESSCGSGSAALALWLSRGKNDGEYRFSVEQPGGIIETSVVRKEGRARSVSIGGQVRLSKKREIVL